MNSAGGGLNSHRFDVVDGIAMSLRLLLSCAALGIVAGCVTPPPACPMTTRRQQPRQCRNRCPDARRASPRCRRARYRYAQRDTAGRDWALRRDNNRSAPQKCRVLGGSIDGATALVVFEADLNGKRQRCTASVTRLNGNWRVRDHGDWSPAR